MQPLPQPKKRALHGYKYTAKQQAEKEHYMELESEREKEWAAHDAEMILKMEAMELTRRTLVEEDNKIQTETLKAQREELKEKQRNMEKERFGTIGQGFFQKKSLTQSFHSFCFWSVSDRSNLPLWVSRYN